MLFLDIERVMLCLCSQAALERKSLAGMTQCWSSGSSYDNFPKSADLACEHYCQSCCCSVARAVRLFCLARLNYTPVCASPFTSCRNGVNVHCSCVPLPLQPLVLRRHEGRWPGLDQEQVSAKLL
jgi:hypothetical protein